ncbi:hypothetical protein AVEN_45272-1, partial [Araneus ventricosus]
MSGLTLAPPHVLVMYRSLRNESEDPDPQRNERTRILLKGT